MKQMQWLSQVEEEILDPHRAICDPHHHLWDYPDSDSDQRRYLLDEILSDTGSGHNIVSTVFVECGSMYRVDALAGFEVVGETEFVNGIAAQSASGQYGETRVAAGIVGMADLRLGAAVREVLEKHQRASDRFKGIRHSAAWDASSEIRVSHAVPGASLMADSMFRQGFRVLAEMDLTFDAWLYHPQIPELTDLARTFPETTIILDHFGGPLGIGPYAGKRSEVFDQWRKSIADLATCPNVVAKLGGLVMPINGFGFHKREQPATSDELVNATRDYYLHTIDCFGPTRCMFESNFPVDKASCSYHVLWNAFKKLIAPFSELEKKALFHDTAVSIYRLED